MYFSIVHIHPRVMWKYKLSSIGQSHCRLLVLVPKSNRKMVSTGKIDILRKLIHYRSFSWLGTGHFNKKSGGVTPVQIEYSLLTIFLLFSCVFSSSISSSHVLSMSFINIQVCFCFRLFSFVVIFFYSFVYVFLVFVFLLLLLCFFIYICFYVYIYTCT